MRLSSQTAGGLLPANLIPVALARELAAAGLVWAPAQGDRFIIDRPGLAEQSWVLSDMVVELHDHPAGQILGFNGTTEWALDSVDAHQALWLPAENQLRALLGPAFVRLERLGSGPEDGSAGEKFRVQLVIEGAEVGFEAPNPTTAYGLALWHVLRVGVPTNAGATVP
jgi:hypothetical protein